ncbi:MAG: helix-turn-helix domain-containing protein, partial [Acidimicrobiales bacterium]
MRFGLWHLDSHANSHHCRIDNGPLQTASQGVANVRKCCDTELTTRLGDGGPGRLAYRLEEAAALLSVSRSTLYRMIDRGELERQRASPSSSSSTVVPPRPSASKSGTSSSRPDGSGGPSTSGASSLPLRAAARPRRRGRRTTTC